MITMKIVASVGRVDMPVTRLVVALDELVGRLAKLQKIEDIGNVTDEIVLVRDGVSMEVVLTDER
jgi:hypothetical protein